MTIHTFEVGTQGSKHRRYQGYKALVTHQIRKLVAQVLANMFGVVGFEVSVPRVVKVNENGHDFTHAQLSTAKSFFATIFQLSDFPRWQKHQTKIIDADK